jgi:hypothetical protein
MASVPETITRATARLLQGERGIALPLALFALIVIGALVTGNFLAGWLEWQAGRSSIYEAQALAAAQGGLDEVLASAEPATLETLPVGGPPVALAPLLLQDRVSADRQISRLTPTLYLIRATGAKRNAAGMALATRSLGLLTRLIAVPAAADPAVTTFTLQPIAERAWVPLF